MKQEWRVVDTGINSGFANMAIDEAIMNGVSRGAVPPTVRFYCWSPPAVTIGYFQNIEKEIDVDKCTELGIDVIRRLTGGRAVLHHQEVTYSIICSENNPVAAGSVVQSYLRISQGLLAGIKKTGIAAELVPHGVTKGASLSPACFDAPSWYELVVEGKKLVGSAQTRKKGIMLQHGSIPLEMNDKMLAELIRFSSDKERLLFKKMIVKKSCALNQHLVQPADYSQVLSVLTEGLEEALMVKLIPGKLSEYEQELANNLGAKYCSHEWNYKAAPVKSTTFD